MTDPEFHRRGREGGCNHWFCSANLLLPAETKFWPRLYFHRRLSFILFTGGGVWSDPGGGACSKFSGGVPAPNFRGGACSKFSGGGLLQIFGGGGACSKFSGGGACSKFSGGGRSLIFRIRSTFSRYASYWNAFLFVKVCAENCMKMKEIGPRVGHTSLAALLLFITWACLIVDKILDILSQFSMTFYIVGIHQTPFDDVFSLLLFTFILPVMAYLHCQI